jgi:hypothetical protein
MNRIEDRAERVAIALPPHAMRYLARMLKRERERMSFKIAETDFGIHHVADYNSLNEIENAIPKAFWDEGKRS